VIASKPTIRRGEPVGDVEIVLRRALKPWNRWGKPNGAGARHRSSWLRLRRPALLTVKFITSRGYFVLVLDSPIDHEDEDECLIAAAGRFVLFVSFVVVLLCNELISLSFLQTFPQSE
jgi:hypothetical protein